MKRPFRRMSYWLQTLLYSLLFLGLAVLIFRLTAPFYRVYDLSLDKNYSFSQQTLEILKQLGKEPVRLVGFFKKEDPVVREIESMLPSFRIYMPKLSFSRYDLEKNPDQARRYGVHEQGILLVEGRGRRSSIAQLNELGMRIALGKLLDTRRPLIFFLKGHGESELNDPGILGFLFMKDRLANEAYELKEGAIEDPAFSQADLVVTAYPKRDFSLLELEKLKAYLVKGNGIFMFDPEEKGIYPNLREFLRSLGVELGDDVILDRSSRLYGADDLISVVTDFSKHEIVKGFEAPLFFPLARSVRMKKGEDVSGWDKDYLVFSGKDSWGEADYASLERGSYSFDEGKDEAGSLPLGLACERKGGSQNRILVFGDSDFVNNTNFNAGGNRLLWLNTVAWALHENGRLKATRLTIYSKPWVIPAEKHATLFFLLVIGPACVSFMILGGFLFVRSLR